MLPTTCLAIGFVVGIALTVLAIACGIGLEDRDRKIEERAAELAAEERARDETIGRLIDPKLPPELRETIATARAARAQVADHGGTY